ncbi:MAG: hypothetical protein YHS30scaffold667_11 [Phage 65_10]|nr:MAG: hypothetical protein YHS30scaffold667_11 [Phage 65_10]
MTRSLFNTTTGEFTGQLLHHGELIAPAGHAWAEGAHDPRRAVVEMPAADPPVVVVRTPARPADSDYQTWAWSDDADDWAATDTLLMLKARARAPVLQRFLPLDAALARPVGEIAEAQALGQTPPSGAVERLTAILVDKQALRAKIAAIDACVNSDELNGLPP